MRFLLLIPLLASALYADRFDFSYAFDGHIIAGQFTGTESPGGDIFDASDFTLSIDGQSEPWRTSDSHPAYTSHYNSLAATYLSGATFSSSAAACDFFVGNGDFADGDFGGNWYFGLYTNESGQFLASLIVLGGAIPDGQGGFIPVDSFIVHDTTPTNFEWTLTRVTEVPDNTGLAAFAIAAAFLLWARRTLGERR